LIDDRKECPTSELDYPFNIYAGGNYVTFTNNYTVYVGDTIDNIPNGEGIEFASV